MAEPFHPSRPQAEPCVHCGGPGTPGNPFCRLCWREAGRLQGAFPLLAEFWTARGTGDAGRLAAAVRSIRRLLHTFEGANAH